MHKKLKFNFKIFCYVLINLAKTETSESNIQKSREELLKNAHLFCEICWGVWNIYSHIPRQKKLKSSFPFDSTPLLIFRTFPGTFHLPSVNLIIQLIHRLLQSDLEFCQDISVLYIHNLHLNWLHGNYSTQTFRSFYKFGKKVAAVFKKTLCFELLIELGAFCMALTVKRGDKERLGL